MASIKEWEVAIEDRRGYGFTEAETSLLAECMDPESFESKKMVYPYYYQRIHHRTRRTICRLERRFNGNFSFGGIMTRDILLGPILRWSLLWLLMKLDSETPPFGMFFFTLKGGEGHV